MSLTVRFLSLIDTYRPAFCKAQAFQRVREHAIASITAMGTKTIATLIINLGRDQGYSTADYRVYSEYKWSPNDIFDPILIELLRLTQGGIFTVAVDDTRVRKTGKKIPGATWHRDPLGPRFQTNLVWGIRWLQFSAIVPLYQEEDTPPRAIPIRFVHAPCAKKPGKKATDEEKKAYAVARKECNLSTLFVREVLELRKALDFNGYDHITLRIVVDGSFCNQTCMSIDHPKIELIARTRKNSRLCFANGDSSSKAYYGQDKFTPEEVRTDPSRPWAYTCLFYAGKYRRVKYKAVSDVLWQRGTGRRPQRLIVVAPIAYIRGQRRHYHQPGYLLTGDLTTPAAELIQSYLDRWQIEVNFREEKTVLGVGEAQVRNPKSVSRQPAFHVAAYSLLLLASVLELKDQYNDAFGDDPIWRTRLKRPSCRALVGLMRYELRTHPEIALSIGMTLPSLVAILRKVS
jgi:hypothetical protein